MGTYSSAGKRTTVQIFSGHAVHGRQLPGMQCSLACNGEVCRFSEELTQCLQLKPSAFDMWEDMVPWLLDMIASIRAPCRIGVIAGDSVGNLVVCSVCICPLPAQIWILRSKTLYLLRDLPEHSGTASSSLIQKALALTQCIFNMLIRLTMLQYRRGTGSARFRIQLPRTRRNALGSFT